MWIRAFFGVGQGLDESRSDFLGKCLKVFPAQVPSHGAGQSQLDGLVNDGANGAGFEVFFHRIRFPEAEDVTVMELAVAAQGLIEGGGADAVEQQVVEGVFARVGPGEVGHRRGCIWQGGGPALFADGDAGKGLLGPTGQLRNVSAGFRGTVAKVGSDVDEVNLSRPMEQPVEVGRKNAISFGTAGETVGTLQVQRHEGRGRTAIGEDAFVDIQHEDFIKVESTAFKQAHDLKALERLSGHVHACLSHPALHLRPGVGQLRLAPQPVDTAKVEGDQIPEAGPRGAEPGILEVVKRPVGPFRQGLQHGGGAVPTGGAGGVLSLPPRRQDG